MARDTSETSGGAVRESFDTSTAELQRQIAALKADLAELTATMAQFGKDQAAALKDQARYGLRAVQERGTEGLTQASYFAGRKYAETEDYVRANPATSVGIAAGLGFLVGLLTARR